MAIFERAKPVDIDALVRRKDLRKLLDLLASDRDADLQSRAARALGELGDDRAVPALIDALNRGNVRERGALLEALGRLGDPRAVQVLINALTDRSSPDKATAAEALGRLGDRRAIVPLAQAMKLSDSRLRAAAAGALVEFGEASVPDLVDLLKIVSDELNIAVCEDLGQIRDTRAVDPLVRLLQSPNTGVRAAASRALHKCRWQPEGDIATIHYLSLGYAKAAGAMGPPAVPTLTAALTPWNRWSITAAMALVKINDTKAVAALLELLVDEDPRRRFWGAYVLSEAKIDLRLVARDLFKTLKDPDFAVAHAALRALLRIASRVSPYMGERLGTNPYGLDGDAVDILRTIRDIDAERGYRVGADVRMNSLGLSQINDLELGRKCVAHRAFRERVGLDAARDGAAVAALIDDLWRDHPDTWQLELDRIAEEVLRLERERSIRDAMAFLRDRVDTIERRKLQELYQDEPERLRAALVSQARRSREHRGGVVEVVRRIDAELEERFVPFWWVKIREAVTRKEREVEAAIDVMRQTLARAPRNVSASSVLKSFDWTDELRDPMSPRGHTEVQGKVTVDTRRRQITTVIRSRKVQPDGTTSAWEEGDRKSFTFEQTDLLDQLGRMVEGAIPGTRARSRLAAAASFVRDLESHEAKAEQARRTIKQAETLARQAIDAARRGDGEAARFAAYDAVSRAAMAVPADQMDAWKAFMTKVEEFQQLGSDLVFLRSI